MKNKGPECGDIKPLYSKNIRNLKLGVHDSQLKNIMFPPLRLLQWQRSNGEFLKILQEWCHEGDNFPKNLGSSSRWVQDETESFGSRPVNARRQWQPHFLTSFFSFKILFLRLCFSHSTDLRFVLKTLL